MERVARSERQSVCPDDAPPEIERALQEPDFGHTVTNHEGRYRIGPLPPFENYWLLFGDYGGQRYLSVWKEGIVVEAGRETKVPNARFRRGQVLRGRVIDYR